MSFLEIDEIGAAQPFGRHAQISSDGQGQPSYAGYQSVAYPSSLDGRVQSSLGLGGGVVTPAFPALGVANNAEAHMALLERQKAALHQRSSSRMIPVQPQVLLVEPSSLPSALPIHRVTVSRGGPVSGGVSNGSGSMVPASSQFSGSFLSANSMEHGSHVRSMSGGVPSHFQVHDTQSGYTVVRPGTALLQQQGQQASWKPPAQPTVLGQGSQGVAFVRPATAQLVQPPQSLGLAGGSVASMGVGGAQVHRTRPLSGDLAAASSALVSGAQGMRPGTASLSFQHLSAPSGGGAYATANPAMVSYTGPFYESGVPRVAQQHATNGGFSVLPSRPGTAQQLAPAAPVVYRLGTTASQSGLMPDPLYSGAIRPMTAPGPAAPAAFSGVPHIAHHSLGGPKLEVEYLAPMTAATHSHHHAASDFTSGGYEPHTGFPRGHSLSDGYYSQQAQQPATRERPHSGGTASTSESFGAAPVSATVLNSRTVTTTTSAAHRSTRKATVLNSRTVTTTTSAAHRSTRNIDESEIDEGHRASRGPVPTGRDSHKSETAADSRHSLNSPTAGHYKRTPSGSMLTSPQQAPAAAILPPTGGASVPPAAVSGGLGVLPQPPVTFHPSVYGPRSWILTPAPQGCGPVQCTIVRDRTSSLGHRLHPVYTLYTRRGPTGNAGGSTTGAGKNAAAAAAGGSSQVELGSFVMAARKRPHNKTSNYVLSLDANDVNRDSPAFVGKLRSNFVGTEFTMYDDGDKKHPSKSSAHMAASSPSAATGAAKDAAVPDWGGHLASVGGASSAAGSSGARVPHLRRELGVVTYASNVLGSRGPRKMKVGLPRVRPDGTRAVFGRPTSGIPATSGTLGASTASGAAPAASPPSGGGSGASAAVVALASEEDSMLSAFRNGYTQEMVLLINKPPKWNEAVGAYVLNFGGRVTQASVKNFQLVSADDHDAVLLQFGRCGKDSFTMDFAWPLCALQAFAVTLSSFDFKLACE